MKNFTTIEKAMAFATRMMFKGYEVRIENVKISGKDYVQVNWIDGKED